MTQTTSTIQSRVPGEGGAEYPADSSRRRLVGRDNVPLCVLPLPSVFGGPRKGGHLSPSDFRD